MVPSSTTELMDTTEQTNANVDDDRLTLNNVIFAGSGHSKCVICRQETRRWMISMPKSARLDLLIIHLMYAPNGVRCCPSHLLNNNRLLPDVEISSVFNIPGTSEDGRKRAADAFDSVRQCLIEKFVPRHLGVQHLTREDAKKQNTSFSIEFFGNNVTIIWDGTYLYMGKTEQSGFNSTIYYRLTTQGQGDNQSLDIINDGTNNKLRLAPTGGYTGQFWKITLIGNGYYRLTTLWQGDGKSLDIANDGTNNTPILAATGAYSGQYWKITPIGNGYYRLTTQSQGDGKSLDIVNNTPMLSATGAYSGQYWKISAV
ncbi:unnamed protein product [Rotaria sordida]|uniref:Ricin B lectin domain-containing protein n=2 Tax=Rotaria sordida TaxID=392033 RepID=A0A819A2J5_9BILA|nr:unnamed protein product [Rotaria sordida]